jgi:hypothetical protein
MEVPAVGPRRVRAPREAAHPGAWGDLGPCRIEAGGWFAYPTPGGWGPGRRRGDTGLDGGGLLHLKAPDRPTLRATGVSAPKPLTWEPTRPLRGTSPAPFAALQGQRRLRRFRPSPASSRPPDGSLAPLQQEAPGQAASCMRRVPLGRADGPVRGALGPWDSTRCPCEVPSRPSVGVGNYMTGIPGQGRCD